jgi:hypothetical protein
MNDDIPKLSTEQPQVVIERSFINHSPLPEKDDNPFNEPAPQAENYGGLFVSNASGATGTASEISPSPSPSETIDFIPESGPIPVVEMQKQHLGKNMELVTNISEDKITYALFTQAFSEGTAQNE